MPDAALNVPARQCLHAPPVVPWYLPASQSVHVLDGDPDHAYLPLEQVSQPVLTPEAALNIPEGQFLHSPPVVSWYLPASQSVHASAEEFIFHLCWSALDQYCPPGIFHQYWPAEEYWPAGQAAHEAV